MQLAVEYNYRLKYIYLYLIWQRTGAFQVTSESTGEKFHKKGTGEDTGEDYKFSSLSIHDSNPSQIGSSFKPRVTRDSI